MASIFYDTIVKGVKAGEIPNRTQQARDWFRSAAQRMKKKLDPASLIAAESMRQTSTIMVGSMYLFEYDPKHKDTLPYYDTFPLIFPFNKVEGGFYGINLHYLPPQLRAKLMDTLYEFANNQKYDESTKLAINYKILATCARSKYIAPCVKHYLDDHVRSKFMYIYPTEWDVALFLPLARFQKKPIQYVYAQARSAIK